MQIHTNLIIQNNNNESNGHKPYKLNGWDPKKPALMLCTFTRKIPPTIEYSPETKREKTLNTLARFNTYAISASFIKLANVSLS